MRPQLKEYKKQIRLFFGDVKHRIRTFSVNGKTLIDIEYEDFLNETHVTQGIRRIIGNGFLLNVKRECSDTLMKQIHERYGHRLSQLELCNLMSSFET